MNYYEQKNKWSMVRGFWNTRTGKIGKGDIQGECRKIVISNVILNGFQTDES